MCKAPLQDALLRHFRAPVTPVNTLGYRGKPQHTTQHHTHMPQNTVHQPYHRPHYAPHLTTHHKPQYTTLHTTLRRTTENTARHTAQKNMFFLKPPNLSRSNLNYPDLMCALHCWLARVLVADFDNWSGCKPTISVARGVAKSVFMCTPCFCSRLSNFPLEILLDGCCHD